MADENLPVGQAGNSKVLKEIGTSLVAEAVVVGATKVVEATLTLTTGASQYAAGDAVANSTSAPTALAFDAVARANGGAGLIVNAIAIDSANQSTKPQLELHLFDTSPTATNDNSPMAISDADALNELPGSPILFSDWRVTNSSTGAGGNCLCSVRGVNIQFVTGSTDDAIYGLVIERGTYTPVASEAFAFRLGIAQD